MTWLRFKKKEGRRLRPGNSRKDIQRARNLSDKSGGSRNTILSIAVVCLVLLGCSALWLWLPTLMKNTDNWLKTRGTFLVKEIVVEGNYRCRRDEIIKSLGLKSRQLTFAFSLSKAQARIEDLPFVEQATIHRRLPNRLQVVIKERQPKALLYLDKLYMVDAEGVVIGPVPAGENLDFPVISGVSLSEWRQRPQVWHRLLKKAVSLILVWEERGQKWSEKVAQVVLDEVCGVTLFTTGTGWELQLGQENYGERLGRWRQVLENLGEGASAVKYFDCAGEASVVAGLRLSTPGNGIKVRNNGQK